MQALQDADSAKAACLDIFISRKNTISNIFITDARIRFRKEGQFAKEWLCREKFSEVSIVISRIGACKQIIRIQECSGK